MKPVLHVIRSPRASGRLRFFFLILSHIKIYLQSQAFVYVEFNICVCTVAQL